MKISELLAKPEAWTQSFEARDMNDNPVDYNSGKACKWCLWGAIRKCYPDYEQSLNVRQKLFSRVESVPDFNDNHSYEEVMQLVRELDI